MYGIERFLVATACLASCWSGLCAQSNLRIVQEWAELKFDFPRDADRQSALDSGFYIPGNSVPIDMDVYHSVGNDSRLFVTIPRFDVGRPVTLGTVDEQGRITGYPDYSWHENQGHNCEGLTSVFRIAIDECDRLWVMDAGKIGEEQVCSPQLLAFDLKTDKLLYRHVVNSTNYSPASLFITPVVDLRGGPDNCKDTFIYVADVTGFALLVVDFANDRSWNILHRYFYPYPSHGRFTIDNESFDLMDGVFGLALSPYRPRRDRYLYFHSLASVTENVVPTAVIRSDSFLTNPNADSRSIKEFRGRRPNQSAAQAMDRNGIMFFGLMDPPSMWCWNSATEYSPRNFYPVAINRETLQFASGVKVVNNVKGLQELWVFTTSFQRVMTGSLDSNRVNFRIHTEQISNLLAFSPCARPRHPLARF